ncbi:MAG: nucleotidyltransferase domain-containing protein [Candidatus Diapherotrites archaeon]
MLVKLFSSNSRTKLLSLFLFGSGKEFHLREIAGLIEVTPIYVSKELSNLVDLGILNNSRRANLSIYSLNEKCIFLNELKELFIKTDFLGELIKKELQGKADYCFIFGSFAKGIESDSSDIDLFVVSEMNEDDLIRLIQKLEKRVKREINYVLWKKKTFLNKAKDNALLKTIKKGKIIMLIGDEDEFRKQIK